MDEEKKIKDVADEQDRLRILKVESDIFGKNINMDERVRMIAIIVLKKI